MFVRLLVQLFIVISFAVTFAIVVLDELYIKGVKQDELSNTRGINQIVINDINQYEDKISRLAYWSQRFNYQFSIKPINDIYLSSHQLEILSLNQVLINVESGFVVDDIKIYYYHISCDCVLVLEKDYGSHGAFQSYLQSFLFFVISALAIFIFYYANTHKNQVNKLVKVYQQYGAGEFSVRINLNTPLPYTPLAKTFNQMAEEIKLLIEEQKTLVHGVSHDLRTPIARLRFALDMTRECNSAEEFMTKIQYMDQDLDELDTLVDEWLFYAELNGKSEKLILENIDLKELTQASVRKIQVLYPKIQFEFIAQNSCVLANSRLLSRAIDNLLTNAGKFAQSKVRIIISVNEVDKNNEVLCLLVEDDGPGIPEQLQNKIVQPFVKLDESRNSSGSGLGLAIVKSILDKHRAQLCIKTNTLGGASFVMTFKKNKHNQ
jgi:two-component system OmpR family sensor kinase